MRYRHVIQFSGSLCFRIKDREGLTDLIEIIDILLLNVVSSEYYKNKINELHKMLSKHGGVSEAADFVEYAAEFGIKHLFCTLGHKYDCFNENKVEWYQTSMIDLWIFIQIIIMINVCLIYKFCCIISRCYEQRSIKKDKTE